MMRGNARTEQTSRVRSQISSRYEVYIEDCDGRFVGGGGGVNFSFL